MRDIVNDNSVLDKSQSDKDRKLIELENKCALLASENTRLN